MTSEALPTSPALKRGERRRWAVVAGAVLLIGWLAVQYVSQAAISTKTDRALHDEKAIVAQLVVVAAQAKTAADQANIAVVQVKAAVTCLNTLLAARGPLTNADTNAEVDIFTRLLAVLVADPKEQAKLYATFLAATRKDVAVLQKDKAFRTTHPLGQC